MVRSGVAAGLGRGENERARKRDGVRFKKKRN